MKKTLSGSVRILERKDANPQHSPSEDGSTIPSVLSPINAGISIPLFTQVDDRFQRQNTFDKKQGKKRIPCESHFFAGWYTIDKVDVHPGGSPEVLHFVKSRPLAKEMRTEESWSRQVYQAWAQVRIVKSKKYRSSLEIRCFQASKVSEEAQQMSSARSEVVRWVLVVKEENANTSQNFAAKEIHILAMMNTSENRTQRKTTVHTPLRPKPARPFGSPLSALCTESPS